MNIKNFALFFVLVLLVVSGSVPVLALEPSQCSAVEPTRPGDTVADVVSDVPAAHIDITEVETSLSGEALTVVFHLRNVPESLTFNRTEFATGIKEYEWEVSIDADNDRRTGPGGFDYLLSAYHVVLQSERRSDLTAPIEEVAKASVWETHGGGVTSVFAYASLAVSAEADTITLVGVIPGITSESRLAFSADDSQFPGESDQIACHDSHLKFTGPWQCDAGTAVIHPGQTVVDALDETVHPHRGSSGVAQVATASVFGGALSTYMDIVEVNTSLSEEILTAVFHLRDVPGSLTFNRKNTPAQSMEYMWQVAIDVDNDRETGDGGFEYLLSAHHIVPQAEKGSNVEVPIGSKAKASVWNMEPGRIISLRDASHEVSADEDTITLSGYIPGITPESRLAFRTHEYAGGSDEVGCLVAPALGTAPSLCDTGGAFRPGRSSTDDLSLALAAHVDVTEISTSLSGETLTVVFHLRDVPETLTLGRTGVPEKAIGYSWEVSIDVDGDRETGLQGYEHILSAMDAVVPESSGLDRSATMSADNMQTYTWDLKVGEDGYIEIVYLEDARFEASAEEDTITLSGEIPGITAESRLAFGVYDYLGGTEEIGCLSPYGLGKPLVLIPSDGPAVTPDQAAIDDPSHELGGHIDIRDVTTRLDGETLTVTFHLSDVPETLTFDRTGVPEHALEYRWEVSIDADNDPETGAGGFDHTQSASYFVHPLTRDSNTVAQITQPGFVEARVWGLGREGNRVLAEAGIEVSAEENTITLSGEIPGITAESRLKFKAFDYKEGSFAMTSHYPSFADLDAISCQPDNAVISPGQSVVDAISDTLPAHIDITEVSTTLAGDETLSVVFHLRDVPETLEFYRKNVPKDALEYKWEVEIDVDNDPETGSRGADYSLGASHFVFSSSSGEGVHLHLDEAVQTNSWQLDEGVGTFLSQVSMEVSPEEDTITFVGDIPGITSQSRLVFETYDYLNGSDRVDCQVLPLAGDTE